MRKFFIFFLCLSFVIGTQTDCLAQRNNIKIKLTFDNQEVVVRMEDNQAVQQFLMMLPAKFEFKDFAQEEKVTNFPKPISFVNSPRGMVASAGKMFIYVPWGNMGIFYKNHGHIADKNLIMLGEVESGLEYIVAQGDDFSAYIEVIQ